MTVSEFAFLALGLVLGIASGAALIVISTARPPAVREIRLTVTPNAIPRRRPSTLSEDAFTNYGEPARGGPADRGQEYLDDVFGPIAEPLRIRTLVRSGPLPPAGAGDPDSSAPAAARWGGGTRRVAGTRNRAPLPASIIASYPNGSHGRTAELTAVPIIPEPDPDLAALRASAARTAETLMQWQRGPAVATVHSSFGATASVPRADVRASNGGGASGEGASVGGSPPRGSVGRSRDAGGARPAGALPGQTQDPCAAAQRVADERCAVAERAREHAGRAHEAVRDAQRTYDEHAAHAERAALAADQRGMRVAKEAAQQAFRRARAAATTRDAIEAAARDWLGEINRINQAARDAALQLSRERQAAEGLLATIERLTVEAHAARTAAEAAEATCSAARGAVADCREDFKGDAARPERPAVPAYPAVAAAAGVQLPTGDHGPASPLEAAFAATGPKEPAVLSLLRGDHAALGRLVERLAGADSRDRRRWQLALAELVDAIVATSIETSILTFPADHPFWGGFTLAQSRDVAAALASLGFRFDGLGGWADDRVPSQRDLSLAVGYAGLDPMRIRRWPTEAETAELYRDVRVAADEYLTGAARGLTLGELVSALGRRADALTEVWNDWERVRPLLLSGT